MFSAFWDHRQHSIFSEIFGPGFWTYGLHEQFSAVTGIKYLRVWKHAGRRMLGILLSDPRCSCRFLAVDDFCTQRYGFTNRILRSLRKQRFANSAQSFFMQITFETSASYYRPNLFTPGSEGSLEERQNHAGSRLFFHKFASALHSVCSSLPTDLAHFLRPICRQFTTNAILSGVNKR